MCLIDGQLIVVFVVEEKRSENRIEILYGKSLCFSSHGLLASFGFYNPTFVCHPSIFCLLQVCTFKFSHLKPMYKLKSNLAVMILGCFQGTVWNFEIVTLVQTLGNFVVYIFIMRKFIIK